MLDDNLLVGDIVESLQGHDKGNVYLVVSIGKKNYVNIIDGKYKKIGFPKLKNPKHLKKIEHSDKILASLDNNITDTELYKYLTNFIRKGELNV